MDQVFSSWKEIAGFLGKGIRTVQRWESALGLPVHRPALHGIVLAYQSELEGWIQRNEWVFPDGGGAITAETPFPVQANGRSTELMTVATALVALKSEPGARLRRAPAHQRDGSVNGGRHHDSSPLKHSIRMSQGLRQHCQTLRNEHHVLVAQLVNTVQAMRVALKPTGDATARPRAAAHSAGD